MPQTLFGEAAFLSLSWLLFFVCLFIYVKLLFCILTITFPCKLDHMNKINGSCQADLVKFRIIFALQKLMQVFINNWSGISIY
jgi:hypothetical protein